MKSPENGNYMGKGTGFLSLSLSKRFQRHGHVWLVAGGQLQLALGSVKGQWWEVSLGLRAAGVGVSQGLHNTAPRWGIKQQVHIVSQFWRSRHQQGWSPLRPPSLARRCHLLPVTLSNHPSVHVWVLISPYNKDACQTGPV